MRRLFLLMLTLGAAAPALAQAASAGAPPAAPSSESQCFGFSFGKWTPALDWKLAGHGTMPDSAAVPQAPGGRGWAINAPTRANDSTLVLFPAWWPVGVIIAFDRTPTAAGDTVAGHAYAMVADGTKSPPRSAVHAWLKPCG